MHRLITIQVEQEMSSFQDLGGFCTKKPESEAQKSYAHAALNVNRLSSTIDGNVELVHSQYICILTS